MKDFFVKNKKIFIPIAILLVIALIFVIGRIVYQKTVTPWNYVIENAYIHIEESMLGMTDIDLYSSGSGLNKRIYLGIQPNEYYIMSNGDVYYYKGPTERNAVTGVEYGRVFKKIGKMSSAIGVGEILIEKAEANPYKLDLFSGSKGYYLIVDGQKYSTSLDLFKEVDKYIK